MNAQPHNADPSELAHFGALASRWWDPNGPQKPLHILNPVRVDYIAAHVQLRDAAVLDVGCGAGLLSEALAARGARVTAIDLAPELIEVAKLHLLESGQTVEYLLSSAEALAQQREGAFDVVACMELLEHVPDPAAILTACARALRPGGQLFVSTLNRTPAAFALAVVGAEYVTGLVPRGTHHYAQFIRPSELAGWLRDAGLELTDVSGLHFNPLAGSAQLGRSVAVNYIATARKPA
jgi:2-polyprenyl-6-hydroxyphenyl methylase/3-demethylubiquinone-9 3-methyltransferase